MCHIAICMCFHEDRNKHFVQLHTQCFLCMTVTPYLLGTCSKCNNLPGIYLAVLRLPSFLGVRLFWALLCPLTSCEKRYQSLSHFICLTMMCPTTTTSRGKQSAPIVGNLITPLEDNLNLAMLFKFKGLVAKQHPTNCTTVHISGVMVSSHCV